MEKALKSREDARKYRKRRKKEFEDISVHTKVIETENQVLKRKILRLECELTSLKNLSRVNFQQQSVRVENQLLKEELKRVRFLSTGLKKFVDSLESENRSFSLCKRISSNYVNIVEEVLAIGYQSLHSPFWETLPLPRFLNISVRTSRSDKLHLLRMDFFDVSINFDDILGNFTKYSQIEFLKKKLVDMDDYIEGMKRRYPTFFERKDFGEGKVSMYLNSLSVENENFFFDIRNKIPNSHSSVGIRQLINSEGKYCERVSLQTVTLQEIDPINILNLEYESKVEGPVETIFIGFEDLKLSEAKLLFPHLQLRHEFNERHVPCEGKHSHILTLRRGREAGLINATLFMTHETHDDFAGLLQEFSNEIPQIIASEGGNALKFLLSP